MPAWRHESNSNGSSEEYSHTHNEPLMMEIVERISNRKSRFPDSFEEMNLRSELLRGIHDLGFKKPTPLQQRVIFPVIKGRDVVVNAWPGAGKKTAFSIAVLQNIDFGLVECQVIVLVSDKQRASQTKKTICNIGSRMNVVCRSIKSRNLVEDISALQKGVHVVVGKPDIIYYLILLKTINTDKVKMCVLDEACEMFPDEFGRKICKIFKELNSNVQILVLFTFLREEAYFTEFWSFLKEPFLITVSKETLVMENINQCCIPLSRDDEKLDVLRKLCRTLNFPRAIVFCNTEQRASWLMTKMKDSISVCSLNGAEDEEKSSAIRNFCASDEKVLIATDILTGDEVQQIPVVVNYDLPLSKEDYVCRIKAADRSSRKGIVINFVSGMEEKLLQGIESYYGFEIEKISVDSANLEVWNKSIHGTTENGQDDKKLGRNHSQNVRGNNSSISNEITTHFVVKTFEDLNLSAELVQGMRTRGFTKPTPLQQRASVPCVNGHDVIIQGPPGTGKKTMFLIAILQNIDASSKLCQALVLVPTRQMAPHILSALTKLGADLGIKGHACVGGNSICNDVLKLKSGVHVVVGTNGRVYDLIRRSVLKTEHIKTFVIVEANGMLYRKNSEQTYDVFRTLNTNIQVIVLSTDASPNAALKRFQKELKSPVCIVERYNESSMENIKHYYIPATTALLRRNTLLALFREYATELMVIYCNKKTDVEWLATEMQSEGIEASRLHGDMKEEDVRRTIDIFSAASDHILVTTDTFIGAEVNRVSVVINLELPIMKETYIQRINMWASSGNKIIVISFVEDSQKQMFEKIKEDYKIKVTKLLVKFSDP